MSLYYKDFHFQKNGIRCGEEEEMEWKKCGKVKERIKNSIFCQRKIRERETHRKIHNHSPQEK